MSQKSQRAQPIVDADRHDALPRETGPQRRIGACACNVAAPVNPDHYWQLSRRAQVLGPHIQVETVFVHAKVAVVRLLRCDLAIEFLKTRLSLRTGSSEVSRPPHATPREHGLWKHPPAITGRR